MAELKDILEGDDAREFHFAGLRLRPVASADVPNRTVFLNSDAPNIRLCFKDGAGEVFRFRMQAV